MPNVNYERELTNEIAILYDTFEPYHLDTNMAGCHCCISAEDLQTVKAKVLNRLTADDLNHFAFKAMTTLSNL